MTTYVKFLQDGVVYW